MILEGERKHTGQIEHFSRSLKRTIILPDDINEQSVQCEMNENGELIVHAQKIGTPVPANKTRPIPLKFEMTGQQK